MEEGTPQGSPLSPVIWLIYIAGTLEKATQDTGAITLETGSCEIERQYSEGIPNCQDLQLRRRRQPLSSHQPPYEKAQHSTQSNRQSSMGSGSSG